MTATATAEPPAKKGTTLGQIVKSSLAAEEPGIGAHLSPAVRQRIYAFKRYSVIMLKGDPTGTDADELERIRERIGLDRATVKRDIDSRGQSRAYEKAKAQADELERRASVTRKSRDDARIALTQSANRKFKPGGRSASQLAAADRHKSVRMALEEAEQEHRRASDLARLAHEDAKRMWKNQDELWRILNGPKVLDGQQPAEGQPFDEFVSQLVAEFPPAIVWSSLPGAANDRISSRLFQLGYTPWPGAVGLWYLVQL